MPVIHSRHQTMLAKLGFSLPSQAGLSCRHFIRKTSLMTHRINDHGQPIGVELPNWAGATHPGHSTMTGHYAQMVALDAEAHCKDLFEAYQQDKIGEIWTYNFIGPFETEEGLESWMKTAQGVDAQPYFVIVDREIGKASGIASFMRIQPDHGVIEIGGITFATCLQRTRVATEAIYLMMKRALGELGYRRLEWKCDALNAPSRAAAERFGFSYDGLFEQAVVYKGRNRDTAWYSLLDRDWAAVDQGFQAWLDPNNFDETGNQIQKLADLIAKART